MRDTVLTPPDAPEHPPTPAEYLRDEPRNLVRLRTYIPTLDRATRGGIPTGIVTAIVGAPHTGKTALVSQVMISAASEGYLTVGLLKDEGRFAGSVRIGQQLGLDRGRLENQEPEEIDQLAEALIERAVYLPDADSPAWTLEATINWIEAKAGNGPRLLAVDSIQSVHAECAENAKTTREAIEAKMRLLERFAKRGGMVLITSEMNRSAYRNKDASENIDGIASGAESRAIEYVSRLLVTLEGDAEEVITAVVKKNSPGGVRPIMRLKFDKASARFRELSEADAEAMTDERRAAEETIRRAKTKEKILKALRGGREIRGSRALYKAAGGRSVDVDDVRDEMLEAGVIVARLDGKATVYSLPEKGPD